MEPTIELTAEQVDSVVVAELEYLLLHPVGVSNKRMKAIRTVYKWFTPEQRWKEFLGSLKE